MNRLFLFIGALLLCLAGGAPTAHAQLGKLKNKAKNAMQSPSASTTSTAPAPTADGDERAEAVALGQALIDVYQRHIDAFRVVKLQDFAYDYVNHGWPDEGEAWKAAVENVESRYDEIHGALRPLADRYGDSWIDIDSAFRQHQINDYDDFGLTTSPGPVGMYRGLYERMEKVAQFRKDAAEGAVSSAGQTMRLISERFFMPEIRLTKAKELKDQLTLAHWFDPQNADVNRMLADIDPYIDEVAADIEQEIDAGLWPEAFGETQHQQTALAFFKSHPEWGGKEGVEVLGVHVAGGWVVTERDLLGRPIQYGLPVYVASTKPQWREMGAARVFSLTALAQTGSPAPQAPPFTGYWVGDSWLARLAKITQ